MKALRLPSRTLAVLVRPRCRHSSTFAHLNTELQSRKIRPIFDDLTPLNSHRLTVSLSDFLPSTSPIPSLLPLPSKSPLPIPHHLLYFEPSLQPHELLPDGTNPAHSPGAPFTRRMWAGGNVRYNHSNPLVLDGKRAVCVEGIRGASVRGREGEEKVFVAIERRMASITGEEERALRNVGEDESGLVKVEEGMRRRLWREGEDDMGECGVLERRNIVFLREAEESAKEAVGDAGTDGAKREVKILKPSKEASLFRERIMPDARLLFRFSALTFNAHAIHLDPLYCRQQEGHRDLLFHGPLSYTLMVVLLQRHLAAGEKVDYVEYRNLAALYCNEALHVCGCKDGEGKYEVWVEGPDGGVKVKGTVRTSKS